MNFLFVLMILTATGRDEFVLDHGLSKEDCIAELYTAPAPYHRSDAAVVYGCRVEGK